MTSSSDQFTFSCPACLRPIRAGVKAVGKTLPCPGCGKTITVPSPDEAKWDAVHEPPVEDGYGVVSEMTEGPRYTSPIVPGTSNLLFDSDYEPPLDRKAVEEDDDEEEEKRVIVERPKLPPHPMTRGLFSMFADPSAIIWFLVLMVLFMILISALVMPIMTFAGVLERTPISYFGALVSYAWAPILSIGILLFSSNCLLCVLQDSAAGNRTIESWPDKAGGAFVLTGMLFVLGALAYGGVLGWALSCVLPVHWLTAMLGVCFFTFPFFLVSSLEVNTPMVPISMNFARSFIARGTTWLVFYAETAVLYAIVIGTTFLIVKSVGYKGQPLTITCAVVLGPMLTFFAFLYFRLLGRLVWVCDEWFRTLEPEEEEEK